MKICKLNFSLLILIPRMILVMAGSGLEAATIEKEYLFDNPEIETTGEYSIISLPGCRQFGPPGQPALPFHPVALLIPPGHVAVSIHVDYLDPLDLQGSYLLMPAQSYRPLSYEGGPDWIFDRDTYSSGDPFPGNFQPVVRTDFMNGYGFALSSFTPVSYRPEEGRITLFRRVRVTIVTAAGQEAVAAAGNFKSSPRVIDRVHAMAQNQDMLPQYLTDANPARTTSYRYLMITNDAFASELDTLIGFYEARGILSKCYTLGYIDTAATGTDMPEKIRNFILEEYQAHDIEYVLLGGDVDVVPYRGFYCSVYSGGGYYTDNNIPSDLYFSSLDGNWNDDGDSRWGEPGEDDLLPEVAVGRLTFGDTVELHNMIHKTIMYQDNPVTADLDRPLLAGEHLYSNPETWGSDYLRLLVGNHSDSGYVTNGIPPWHDIDTLYDRYSSWSKQRLIDSINNGHSYIHHVGHANYNYVMKMGNADITNSNFSQANGITRNYPVVYTHGCMCGGFDNSDCIAERMIGIDNFAVAFVGNSRYGWFVEGTTDGPSQHLHREFVDAIYSDSLYRIGMAHMRSKAETAPFVDLGGEYEPGAHRWCFYDCNVLGDPAMALWTEAPHGIEVNCQPLICIGAESMQVCVTFAGTAQKGMVCAFFQSGSLVGTAETDSTGVCHIPLAGLPVEDSAQLVVSGFNVLPHTFPIHVADYWKGLSSDWNDPENWFTGQVPDSNTDIIIPATPEGSNFPISNSGNDSHCRRLFLEPGALVELGENDTLFLHGN